MNPATGSMTRRRMISISAGLAGAGLVLGSGSARALTEAHGSDAEIHEWRGVALGAQTSIKLAHDSRAEAVKVLARCRNEIDRLEDIFSLYRPGSQLARLNRAAVLERPAPEMRQCLAEARRIGEATHGAFDISVGSLWVLHAAGEPLSQSALKAALDKVDYTAIKVSQDRIVLGREGMSLTLNGIAQGFITDRITALLQASGFERVLVNLGELRAGTPPVDDNPWRVRIDGLPQGSRDVVLTNGALATSSAAGLTFNQPANKHQGMSHLVDPRTGLATPLWRQVSVAAPTAATADALSTGLSFVETHEWAGILKRIGARAAAGLDAEGFPFAVGDLSSSG